MGMFDYKDPVERAMDQAGDPAASREQGACLSRSAGPASRRPATRCAGERRAPTVSRYRGVRQQGPKAAPRLRYNGAR